MEAAKRVAKNTGYLYMKMGITVFISLYVTRLVLSALGTEDFGTFSVVGGAVIMLSFLNNAMTAATQRFMSFAQGEGKVDKQKSIFNVSIVLHFIIAILIVVILEIAGYLLFEEVFSITPNRINAAKIIYQFLIVSTFFTIISVPFDAVINAHEDMLFVAIVGILESFLKLGIALFITYTSYDKLITYGLLMALLTIITMFLKQIYCKIKYSEVTINFGKYYNTNIMLEMRSFAGWSFLGSSSSIFAHYGQGIVINTFFGTSVNAAQGITNQVSGQLGAFANSMMKALNPIIAKSEGAGNRSLMIKASIMGSKISFLLLLIFYIPVIIEMPFIFNLWLTEVPNYAIVFTKLLLIKNLIEQLYLSLNSSIAAVGKIKDFQKTTFFLNFSPLIISFVMFYLKYPPYYLYIVFIVYSILKGALTLYYSKKEIKLSITDYFIQVIYPSLISLIIMYSFSVLPSLFLPESLFRLMIVLLLNISSFLLVTWYIILDKEGRMFLHKKIKNKSNRDE